LADLGKPFWKTWTDLDALLSWQEGWNGYDAATPRHEAIGHAVGWIEELYEDTLTTGERWMAPNVVFEWWEAQRKLTVYIHPETVEYVKV
jgi:hypothetical protein